MNYESFKGMWAMKKLILALMLLGAMTSGVGCSSSDESGAETDSGVSDELASEGGDSGGDVAEAAESKDEVADADSESLDEVSEEKTAENGENTEVVADAEDEDLKKLEEELPSEVAAEGAPAGDQAAAAPAETPAPEAGFGDGTAPTDQAAAAPAPTDPLASENSTTELASAEAPAPAPVPVTLKKIKDAPFEKSGTLLNTVYIAREGDTAKSVANLVYNDESRASDLKAWNTHIKRGVKIGDKIYYNSPSRSTDSERMLTFYEDKNIPSETYVSQPGDNIKDVAETLIGKRESWKELWATNSVESKGKLPPQTELRYWPKGANTAQPEAPTQTMAQSTLPPPPANPPPPPSAVAPPPAVAAVEPPPPPPPADPPPPPVAAKPKELKKKGGALGDMDQDTTFMMGVGGMVLLGGVAAMAFLKKSRARRLQEGQTQI